MKLGKFSLVLTLMLIIGIVLSACGADKDKDTGKEDDAGKEETPGTTETPDSDEGGFSVAMVTDVGGIDDKSFNQSAWKGIKDFGKANNLEKGDGGYDYLQSQNASDYTTNLNKLVRRDFDLVFGVGHIIADAVEEIAGQQPDTHFALIDGVIEGQNVVNVLFKDQEAGYLAGVAAALSTKTNKVGFVGGVKLNVIERFEAGFVAGVESINPDIEIDVEYTGAFDRAELGKATANLMYTSGVDVIFHAAGGTGTGVFAEAKERKTADKNANVWVIGVDSDQYDEGQVGDDNITLTSAMKRVDLAVEKISELAMNGEFQGGETIVYGLAEEGVFLSDSRGALSEESLAIIEEHMEKIVNGEIVVPEIPGKK